MNLKIKTSEIELELTNADVPRIEKSLLAIFEFLKGGSFTNVYKTTDVKDYHVGNKQYVKPINGVRTHENGTVEYRCSYSCSCGNTGVRYVQRDVTTTTCHKCKGELIIMPSTTDSLYDSDFNYFVAY